MQKLIVIVIVKLAFTIPINLNAQHITIKSGNITEKKNIDKKIFTIDYSKHSEPYYIQVTDFGAKEFVVYKNAAEDGNLSFENLDTSTLQLVIDKDSKVYGTTLTIREENHDDVLATIVFPEKENGGNKTKLAKTPHRWILNENKYGNGLTVTNYGLIIEESDKKNVPDYVQSFTGSNFVHLFFDGNGNSIITTVPQGIANMQYVVHVVYLTDSQQAPSAKTYSLRQKTGSFSGKLVFRGEESISDIAGFQAGGQGALEWVEEVILLSTSTSDIEFEIIRTSNGENTKIATHTIKMSPIIHGTFEVGLINSKLASPTFEFVPLPSDTSMNTTIRKNAGNRGIITIMATLYTSPIILIESLLGLRENIPIYQLYGRNFLNDHRWYERIYPTVGIRLNTSRFENLFFGVNFEVARGGSFFIGGHYGEVNTFSTAGDLKFGESVITQAEFNNRKDKNWKFDLAFGANIDIAIVKNLFKK